MRRSILTSLVILAVLSACNTTTPKQAIFKQESPRMVTIYHNALNNAGHHARQSVITDTLDVGQNTLGSYTRTAASEIHNLFPELPNPTLVMYVFPHITSDRVKVPGFSTVFKLYSQAHYALPGETP